MEDSGSNPPDEADCRTWRAGHEHQEVITLFDPTQRSFVLFEENYTSLNVFVDANRVITSKVHTDVTSAIRAGIRSALGE